jgi:hypothetical protein
MRVADRVYGEIDLPSLAVLISQTREFERLDGVRQLGGCAFVYPSATHTRREHSLGVCALAMRAGAHLKALYPTRVTADDVLCAGIAGLVHDLGHGPFSHVFENYVEGFCHETMGIELFDRMMDRIDAQQFFDTPWPENKAMIKLMVSGLDAASPWPSDLGRSEDKRFLCDIVHARATGLDVDKLDYLARDSLAVFGATNAVPVDRIIHSMRLADGLAFDERSAYEIADVFRIRAKLHRILYQHRKVAAVEGELVARMRSVDAGRVPGQKLADAAFDPERFVFLTDAAVLQSAPITVASLARLPITVCLRAEPYCNLCRAPTAVEHRFCAACGHTTRYRPAVESTGCLDPPEVALTSAEATEHVKDFGAVVHVTDISYGAETTVLDPFGRRWRTFHPLLQTFVRRDGTLCKLDPNAFFVPRTRRTRIATCYAAQLTPELARAFVAWGNAHGDVVEN